MKYRIGFVTNSSSYSSLVVHHIESELLKEIFEKYSLELSLLEDNNFLDSVFDPEDIVCSSLSGTVLGMLYQFEGGFADSYSISEEDFSAMTEEISTLSSKIDEEASCDIEYSESSDELDGFKYGRLEDIEGYVEYWNTKKLLVFNGKGKFIDDYGCNHKHLANLMPSSNIIMLGDMTEPLKGMTFLVVGELERYTIGQINWLIKWFGGVISDSISEVTNYVISNNTNTDHLTLGLAKELGVTVISEQDFEALIGNDNIGVIAETIKRWGLCHRNSEQNSNKNQLDNINFIKTNASINNSMKDDESNIKKIPELKKGKKESNRKRWVEYTTVQDDDYFNKKYVYHASLSGLRFAVIGHLEHYCIEGISNLIRAHGGTIKNSITKTTNFVITNFPDSNTSKLKKAVEFDIPIISEEEFEKMVGKKKAINSAEDDDYYNKKFEYNYESLNGLLFVITGDLDHYCREGITLLIEKCGGAVKDKYVTKNTNYVITNYPDSGTSKLKKAAEYCIPVISEEKFEKMVGKRAKGTDPDSNSNEHYEVKCIYITDEGSRTSTKAKSSKANSASNDGYSNHKNDHDHDSLNGMLFVISGTFEHYSRKEIVQMIINCDGRVKNSISKATNYVICNTPDENSTLIKGARKYGIEIISVEELEKMIGKSK